MSFFLPQREKGGEALSSFALGRDILFPQTGGEEGRNQDSATGTLPWRQWEAQGEWGGEGEWEEGQLWRWWALALVWR